MATPYRMTTTFWDHATLWNEDDESLAGHTTDGGRVFGITRTRYAECDRYGCQPVAVVAYEDREQIERLYRAIYRAFGDDPSDYSRDDERDMQAALREFANPKPPKCPARLDVQYGDGKGQPLHCNLSDGHEGPHSGDAFMWTAVER